MTLFERMRALPEDCRAALRRASAWAVLAALLDAACGVLLVPLVEAWFAEGALPWRWVAALLGLSLAQALLQYLALRRGFAAGGSLAAGLVRSLVARLPRLAPPALRRVAPAEGLLRGPVMQAMGIPAHLLGPLIAAMVTPLGVILGLFLIDPSIALGLLVAGAVLAALLRWSGRRNLAVGSSSSSNGAVESSPRARHRRCRWPPDSSAPPGPTSLSQPCGQASISSSRPTARAASRSASRSASARAMRRFQATLPRNRPLSWNTRLRLAARVVSLNRRISTPPSRTRPASTS